MGDCLARICVVHWSLTRSFGGAERLCIETVNALTEEGNIVDLVVTEKTNLQILKQRYNHELLARKELVIFPSILMPSVFANLLNWFLRDIVFVPIIKKRYDLTINTGPLIPNSFDDLMYIQDYPGKLHIHGKYRFNLWRPYSLLYDTFVSIIFRFSKLLKKMPILLINSQFNKHAAEKYLNADTTVLYPPVDVECYLPLSSLDVRENIVLTISRIDESKGLELIPYVASKVDCAKFVIIGSVGSESCFQNLQKLIKELGLEKKVLVISNASELLKKEYLAKAKIYLHSSRYEAFGISVVEAMASGLLPIVFANGAPWVDILNETQGLYGYGYSDPISCANLIRIVLSNDSLRNEIIQRAITRSFSFSRRNYKKRLIELVGKSMRSQNNR